MVYCVQQAKENNIPRTPTDFADDETFDAATEAGRQWAQRVEQQMQAWGVLVPVVAFVTGAIRDRWEVAESQSPFKTMVQGFFGLLGRKLVSNCLLLFHASKIETSIRSLRIMFSHYHPSPAPWMWLFVTASVDQTRAQ